MPFFELVAVTMHSIAAQLFRLVDGGFHKSPSWPGDDVYQQENLLRPPTPFSLVNYWKPQYPDGVADIVGYWAEDRIFGGVVLFGRGNDPDVRSVNKPMIPVPEHDDVCFSSYAEFLFT